MPRLVQPLKMRQLALQSLAVHFEPVAYGCPRGPILSRMVEDDSYLTVDSPFAHWPSDLLEELLETIALYRPIGRAVLHQLVQPQLESLNFAAGVGDVYFAIQFIIDRCQNLQRLDLSYISFLGPNALCQLVDKLPNIKSINFQMTPVTDQVMHHIGHSCRQLRHLDVSSSPVTDRGLLALSRDENGCPLATQLVRLALLDTQVTTYGVALVLHALPQLRQVEYESIFQVFDHMAELGNDEQALESLSCRYRMTALKSCEELNKSESFLTAIQLCPDLESIALAIGSTFRGETLWQTTRLHNLSELSLTNGPALTLDFYLNVVPVLQTIGHQLDNLILTRFSCVDVLAVGSNCRKLKNLALAEMCHFIPVESHQFDASLFTELRALELWTVQGVKLPSAVVKQLLTSCRGIQNLLFRNCDDLTDALLNELWAMNPMPELSHATFDGCQHVSLTILISLLQREGDLNMLRLWNCPQLDYSDYAVLKATVESGNMDVNLDWYPYAEFT